MAIPRQQNNTVLARATTVSSTGMITDAVIVDSETQEAINGSFCRIINLKVYRGRGQAYEIRHDGFSLSYSGNIEVRGSLINKLELIIMNFMFYC